MEKRFALQTARPRVRWSIPAYPTLAAAGLSLWLGGCSPAGTIEAPFKQDAPVAQADLAREAEPRETFTFQLNQDAPLAPEAEAYDSQADDGVSEAGRQARDAGVTADASGTSDTGDKS
jgi:hypothetical protein